MSRRFSHLSVAIVAIVVAACTRDAADPTGILAPAGGADYSIVSGNNQSAAAGSELPAPLVVRVVDSNGLPIADRLVNFVVTEGGGSVFAGRALTNASGIAQEYWTLGATPGANAVEVRAVNSSTGQAMVFGTFRATGLDAGGLAAIGEFGRVTVRQQGEEWHTVTLSRSFSNPVVVMGPPSQNGAEQVSVRVRNVQANRFEFQIDEWEYLDQAHTTESLSYLVIEAGSHQLADGTPVQAGVASVTHSWRQVAVSGFSTAPVVLSQASSVNDAASVTTRLRSVTQSGFQVRLQESQASDGFHAAEDLHWIALGVTTLPGVLEVARTANSVTDAWTSVPFAQSYSGHGFLAAMQTYDGSDPASLRYDALTGSGVNVRVEEEASVDAEVAHTTEVVGYVVLSPVTLPGAAAAQAVLLGRSR